MGENGFPPSTAVCTIVSKNLLHCARVLMASVSAVHPDWHRFVLVVDEIEEAFDPGKESFQVLELGQLALTDPKRFRFCYNLRELNAAVKPWLLEWLFLKAGMDRVIFLAPEACVYRPLVELETALDGGALMVLTPHLTGEINHGHEPSEREILKWGCYNLGFIALARHRRLDDFLSWWQCKRGWSSEPSSAESATLSDRWIDLVPGLFDGVVVLRHEGYGVASWNLEQRRIERRNGRMLVNGQELAVIQFSGLDALAPESSPRSKIPLHLGDLGDGAALGSRYCQDLLECGLEICRHWPYTFGRFDDGSTIPDVIRAFYRCNPLVQRRASGDPFRISAHAYLNEPSGHGSPPLTVLVRWIWEQSADLRRGFPDFDGRSRPHLAQHFVSYTAREWDIPELFVDPVRKAIKGYNRRPLRRAACIFQLLTREIARRLCRPGKKHDHSTAGLAPARSEKASKAGPSRRPFLWTDPARDGLNVVGFVRSEAGVGESARLFMRSAEAAGLPCSLHDADILCPGRKSDTSWAHMIGVDNPHPVNVFHINADGMQAVRSLLGEGFFAEHYNIGFWHWELPELPDSWRAGFDHLDEVWAPSRFVRDAIAARSPVPVLVMPHAVRCDVSPALTRAGLGLPESAFLFLTMYDTHSYRERKNPEAAIEAFRKAFPDPRDVSLVLKINNPAARPEEVRALKARLAGVPGIIILDRILKRRDVFSLEAVCDCYVSLHRSEGFGLGLAESMFLGKPAVGTGWSGNVDFMDADNSCPVDYRLVRLARDYGPYERGQIWADPDVDHAAWLLARLVADPAWRRARSERGQYTIRTRFSPEVVGARYRRRLEEIRQQPLFSQTACAA